MDIADTRVTTVTGTSMNLNVATRYYKPPELMFRLRQYDYSMDMWSFGCLFGELVRTALTAS
jgi:serine/threonine protein kinase